MTVGHSYPPSGWMIILFLEIFLYICTLLSPVHELGFNDALMRKGLLYSFNIAIQSSLFIYQTVAICVAWELSPVKINYSHAYLLYL